MRILDQRQPLGIGEACRGRAVVVEQTRTRTDDDTTPVRLEIKHPIASARAVVGVMRMMAPAKEFAACQHDVDRERVQVEDGAMSVRVNFAFELLTDSWRARNHLLMRVPTRALSIEG